MMEEEAGKSRRPARTEPERPLRPPSRAIQRTFLRLRTSVLAAVLILLLWVASSIRAELTQAARLEQSQRVAAVSLLAGRAVALQRGYGAAIATSPGAAGSSIVDTFTQASSNADARLEETFALAERLVEPGEAHGVVVALAHARTHHAELREARQRIRRAWEGVPAAFDVDRWLDTSNVLIEALGTLRLATLPPESPLDGGLIRQLALTELVSITIDYTGRQRALLAVVLTRGTLLEARLLERLQKARSIADYTVGRLAQLAEDESDPEFAALLANLGSGSLLREFSTLRDEVVRAGRAGAPYPVDAEKWLATATRGVDELIAVEEAFGQRNAARVRAAAQGARQKAAALAAVTLWAMGAVVFSVFFLRRRLMEPLQRLQATAIRLAAGDLATPLAARRVDEMGDLFLAFEEMRASLAENDATQRELIQQLTATKEQLAALANHDALTDLWNRRAFEARLGEQVSMARRYGQPGALLLFDLDSFKPVNDCHGHAAGDAVLRAVGALLRKEMRDTDMAARLGGDEFAVLLPMVDQAGAQIVAERLRRGLAAMRVPVGAAMASVTGSIGIVCLAEGKTAPETLLVLADEAMYQAKRGGGDRISLCSRCPNCCRRVA